MHSAVFQTLEMIHLSTATENTTRRTQRGFVVIFQAGDKSIRTQFLWKFDYQRPAPRKSCHRLLPNIVVVEPDTFICRFGGGLYLWPSDPLFYFYLKTKKSLRACIWLYRKLSFLLQKISIRGGWLLSKKKKQVQIIITLDVYFNQKTQIEATSTKNKIKDRKLQTS